MKKIVLCMVLLLLVPLVAGEDIEEEVQIYTILSGSDIMVWTSDSSPQVCNSQCEFNWTFEVEDCEECETISLDGINETLFQTNLTAKKTDELKKQVEDLRGALMGDNNEYLLSEIQSKLNQQSDVVREELTVQFGSLMDMQEANITIGDLKNEIKLLNKDKTQLANDLSALQSDHELATWILILLAAAVFVTFLRMQGIIKAKA